MSTTLIAPMIVEQQAAKRPQVVEVIGPAGAGKSMLCGALSAASGSVQLSTFPDVRRLANAAFFARHGLQTAASFGRLPRQGSRRLNRQELAWLSILHGWPHLLQSEFKSNPKVQVLDQGPIYLLSELRESGPRYLNDQVADAAWGRLYAMWAGILTTVVYLDAPDPLLAARIRAREKLHIMKDQPDDVVFNFLCGFRVSYQRVLTELCAQGGALQILAFDTSKWTPDEIAGQLLLAFGLTA